MKPSEDIEVKTPNSFNEKKPSDFFKKDSRSKEKTFNVSLPSFSKESVVLTLGSCFAHNIRNSLSSLGLKTNSLVFYDDDITTTLAMKEHFEWIVADKTFRTENLHARSAGTTLQNINDQIEEYKKQSLVTLTNCSSVILTFGLSETWIDSDGRSLWRWPGRDKVKSENLSFKILSTEENKNNIKEIISLIKQVNPTTSIIITLSPIPLGATFRKDYNINIANTASKTRIRSAIDEFFIENTDDKIFYWPSYEFVTQHADPWEQDGRHVKPEIIQEIMGQFIEKAVTKSD
jgi:hypothetical protein